MLRLPSTSVLRGPVQLLHELVNPFIRLRQHVAFAWALKPVGVERLELGRQRPGCCRTNMA